MRTFQRVLVVAILWLSPRPVRADDLRASRVDLAASVAYGAPIGDAERGGRVRDTTIGAVGFALEAGYRLLPRVGVAVHLQYAVGIPTLCHTASDCESSLGSDVFAVLSVRVYLPDIGPFAPVADVGMGYEWLTTRFSDSGASSARSYEGPILLSAWLAAPFRLGHRWTLGPVVGVTLSTFTVQALQTNVGSVSGNVPVRAVHAWLLLGPRLSYSF